MASDALLSLRDVRVHYGKFLAVDGLSLELHGGQGDHALRGARKPT